MEWARDFYHPVFQRPQQTGTAYTHDRAAPALFSLRENDFVFGDQKFGGNAQYITKWRFVHHTSFLWDYDNENMKYLSLPDRRPDYRRDRDHGEFLGKLKDYMHPPTKNDVLTRVVKRLGDYFDHVEEVSISDVIDSIDTEHIKNTALLSADAYA
jgi:lipoate-protein ligase A